MQQFNYDIHIRDDFEQNNSLFIPLSSLSFKFFLLFEILIWTQYVDKLYEYRIIWNGTDYYKKYIVYYGTS